MEKTAHSYESFLRQSNPLLEKIGILVKEILHVYQHIQINKKICDVLLEEVLKIETFVNSSKYRPILTKSSKQYQRRYNALHQLLYLLEEIKGFIDDMSHLKKIRKYLNIEQKFIKIISKYDKIIDQSTIEGLNMQKEMRCLQSDLANNRKFLEHIQGGIVDKYNNVNTIFEEIESLKEMKTSLKFNISELKLSSVLSDNFSPLQKMQINGLNDVATKPLIGFKLYDDSVSITEIAILKKLNQSNNIIKFYGIMKLDIGFISVYEWAESGNLKDYYETEGNNFNWGDKFRIALDICRGLCFLQNADIPHHNLRCENVLLSNFLEAKITGFQKNYSRILRFEKGSKKDEIRWSAPEYLVNKKNWSIKSEIFSLAMLLWELGHQKIPYSDLKDDNEISEIIISGKKKNFDNVFNSNDYLKKYKKIICDAWTIDPNIRPTIVEIFLKLLRVQKLYLNSIKQQSICDGSETIQNKNLGIQLLESQDLQNPFTIESDRRGKKPPYLIKKLYTKESIEVACKPLNTTLYSTNKIQEIVSIFNKLGNDSIHIIKFYGLANLNNYVNLVIEWAELGNLQETYEIYKISWKLKIQIALGICDGLKFIHGRHLFHRNLRCKSIKVNQSFKPKIANFGMAIEEKKSTIEFNPLNINWSAPELFKSNKKYSYNCDTFSFVMLLWELAFEKIPYKNWDNQKIIDHITNGNNEKIDFDPNDPDIQKNIRKEYTFIIQEAWRQKRNLDLLQNDLDKLYEPVQNIDSEILLKKSTNFERNLQFIIGIKNKYLQEAIKFRFIDIIPYSEFENKREIGSGGYGRIYKAHWKKTHGPVACKYLINSTDNIQDDKYWQAFINELNLHSRGSKSENIIKILGISYSIQDERLFLIMEYASDGDLRAYLKSKNNTLTIEQKVKLAFDVTKGLHYLHEINIIHRDLHAKNIVIHEGKAKITDFGSSKFADEQTKLHKSIFGILPYIAPELFSAGPNEPFPYSKASDIYSFGVLFWEIVSCKTPFESYSHDITLITHLIKGGREKCVDNNKIPQEYREIYKLCWDGVPRKRPNIEFIYEKMKEIYEKILNTGNNIIDVLFRNEFSSLLDLDQSSNLSIEGTSCTVDVFDFSCTS